MKTICDMHDEAMEAVAEIQGWVNDAQNTEFANVTESTLTEWIDFLSLQAWLIEKAVAEAKQAGIRMENGLSRKRDRLSDLESENSDQASKINDLESEVRQLENTVAYLEERLGNYE